MPQKMAAVAFVSFLLASYEPLVLALGPGSLGAPMTNCSEASFEAMCESFDNPGDCHWCSHGGVTGQCLNKGVVCPPGPPAPPPPPGAGCTVSLTKQESKVKCTAGESYGCTGNATSASVWVLGGCRGQFVCNSHRPLECASDGEKKATCPCPGGPPPPPPPPPPPCTGPHCFTFTFDNSSGTAATTLPTGNFSVRKLEAIYYPLDKRTYAYVDIVNYSDHYYPASYSSEVGVYSSPDGKTQWEYHGIVIPRGVTGGWDGGGIASPGAAVGSDGVTVLVGYAGENSPRGGINRGIGVAIASHPLGPFVKSSTLIGDPKTICSGTGRCDDVIMQLNPVDNAVHIYHSVKGSNVAPGDGIRHRVSTDNGKTWSASKLVLSTRLQPGHVPAESIAGKYFPEVNGGKGGMVIITDGCSCPSGLCLHAYISIGPGDMENFVPATQPYINSPASTPETGPTGSLIKGNWASDAGQIGFIPGADGHVTGVTYSLWNGVKVLEHYTYHGVVKMSMGYTHTVFNINVSTPSPAPPPAGSP